AKFSQQHSFGRKLESGRAAFAQNHAYSGFQALQRKAYRRLLEEGLVGCPGYPASRHDLVEYLQWVPVQIAGEVVDGRHEVTALSDAKDRTAGRGGRNSKASSQSRRSRPHGKAHRPGCQAPGGPLILNQTIGMLRMTASAPHRCLQWLRRVLYKLLAVRAARHFGPETARKLGVESKKRQDG